MHILCVDCRDDFPFNLGFFGTPSVVLSWNWSLTTQVADTRLLLVQSMEVGWN